MIIQFIIQKCLVVEKFGTRNISTQKHLIRFFYFCDFHKFTVPTTCDVTYDVMLLVLTLSDFLPRRTRLRRCSKIPRLKLVGLHVEPYRPSTYGRSAPTRRPSTYGHAGLHVPPLRHLTPAHHMRPFGHDAPALQARPLDHMKQA